MLGGSLSQFTREVVKQAGLSPVLKRAASRINFEIRGQAYGSKVVIPSINGIRCDLTEPFMAAILRRVLASRRGSVVDVGVNLGQTLLKVKTIDPARTYVGFEPNPTCVYYVQELIRANAFSDCTVLPVGLFRTDAVLSLLSITDTAVDSAASLIRDLRPPDRIRRVVHVPVMRYESVSAHLEANVALIKIDVEGAELEVMQTLSPLIDRDRPVILVEVLPSGSPDNRPSIERQDAIVEMLRRRGYVIDRVIKDAQGEFSAYERVPDFGIHNDLSRCDYVLSPEP